VKCIGLIKLQPSEEKINIPISKNTLKILMTSTIMSVGLYNLDDNKNKKTEEEK